MSSPTADAGAVRPPVPALSARLAVLVAALVTAAALLSWALSALGEPDWSPARIAITGAVLLPLVVLGRDA